MLVPYGGPVYGDEEKANMLAALDSGRFWDGEWTHRFQKDLASYLHVQSATFCNSGSSALMLAISALKLPEGKKVAIASIGFPTALTAILRNGLKPVFVDIMSDTLNVNADMLRIAIQKDEDIVAYLHCNIIGNCSQMNWIRETVDDCGIPMIEDSCDSLGGKFADRYLGTWGDIGCYSHHPAHHITTMLGGSVVTDNPTYADRIQKMNSWGRDTPKGLESRFHQGLDLQYYYTEVGYNYQAPEVCAAMGVAQLKKLDHFNDLRYGNINKIRETLANINYPIDRNYSPGFLQYSPDGFPPIFGYPVMTHKDRISNTTIMQRLENLGIQTRSIYGGPYIDVPAFNFLDNPKSRKASTVARRVWEQTFWVSCYHGLSTEQLQYLIECLKKVLV